MNRYMFQKVAPIALAVTLASPLASHAESNFQTGAGTLTATAHVDFTIVIPRVLSLQVGTGSLFTNNATVDLISFNVPTANVGDGTAIAGTGGDLTGGAVTARVRGNVGNVTLATTSAGAMTNGATGTIPWTQITTTPTSLTANPTLTPAAIPASGSASVSLTAVNNVVAQDARWTYAYLNSNVVEAGTYGGPGGTNNGRVTYTATSP